MVGSDGAVWQVLNLIASLLIFFLLFAAMFKLLPDVHIEWRDVWVGAAITAVLFIVGKYAIGKYLGMSSVGSAYGAAGSLVVLLVWVYYSTLIFFFGAELTQEYARRFGAHLAPNRHAQWADDAPERKDADASGGGRSPVTHASVADRRRVSQ
jgi:membrane protein